MDTTNTTVIILAVVSQRAIVRGLTDDSTKIAGIRRSAMKLASPCTSPAPASAAVEMPWRPRTSKP